MPDQGTGILAQISGSNTPVNTRVTAEDIQEVLNDMVVGEGSMGYISPGMMHDLDQAMRDYASGYDYTEKKPTKKTMDKGVNLLGIRK